MQIFVILINNMKQLHILHPLLLITIGYPGAGKSTLARRLAEEHNFAWIHANRLRYELFSDPAFAKNEEDVVNNLTEYMLGEMLRTKSHIVFDGNASSRAARGRMIQQAKKAGYDVLTVWVQTDLDTAFARSNRHTATQREKEFVADMPQAIFDRLAAQLTKPLPSETCLVVSGKHTPNVQISALQKKLIALYKPQAESAVRAAKQNSTKKTDGEDEQGGRPSAHPDQRSRPRFDIMRRIKIR